MNILVTGCNGQLGNEIQILQCQHPEHTYFNTDIQSEAEGVQNYSRLDITDKSEVRAFVMDNAIDCVVNCAAYTAVDLAESNRELCATLNALAPAYLAEAVDKRGGFIIHISTDYVFDGTLDIHKLFTVSDVAEAVAVEWEKIETNLLVAERLLLSPNEPKIDLFAGCKKPYLCSFWKYCSRHLPQPSVFDLYRMQFSKKIKFYRQGIISYEDLLSCPAITNDKQLRQIEFALQDKGTYIEKENIRFFLGSLSYPLYFLDFETMQPVIPKFVGTKPYAQIPFQYSLHYIECEGGELKHKEFLAESGSDPRRARAERLCADIPMNTCVPS